MNNTYQPSEHDDKFNYMLLDRLRSDCEYYLGFGNRNVKTLWESSEKEHIATMKRIFSHFKGDKVPKWITMQDIEKYEREMCGEVSNIA